MENTSENQTTPPPVKPEPTPEQQQKDKFRDLHYHYHKDCRHSAFPRFFWGLFVILIGVMFLAKSLGFVSDLNWHAFFGQLWPVLIIFIGLSIMSRGGVFSRIICSILMVAILAFIVVWFFQIPLHARFNNRDYNWDPRTMQQVWPDNNR